MAITWKHALIAMGTFAFDLVPAAGMGILNPAFTVRDILPSEMKSIPGIGGMDLLPNGDGVVCTWGGSQKSNGEVWIVPALATGNPGIPVRIVTGLREALGVAVAGNDFFVMEKPRILKFKGAGGTWTQSTFFTLDTTWYNDKQWQHFSFNLVYQDNALWFTTGSAYPWDMNEPRQRGALMRVALDGSGYKQMARGLNSADGIGVGPEGEFFTTDNQGYWRPANCLYWIPVKGNLPANGRFYGFRTLRNNACKAEPPAVDSLTCAADPEYPPAIWLPYGSFSRDPTRPILLKAGPYAGQMISGDIFHGGILRYQVEKVNDEWQGAAFTFQNPGSEGINFGIHQFLYTPSGSLLVGGIGGGFEGLGGEFIWSWNGTVRGLDLLTPATVPIFDLLAIRSLKDGFDVEFTQPASVEAGQASSWSVSTTVYTPTQNFGADLSTRDNDVPVEVTSATRSADGKHVHIKLASLLPRRMYAIRAIGVTSAADGQDLYTNTGYYTLNTVSPDSGNSTRVAGPDGGYPGRIHTTMHRNRIAFDLPVRGPWIIDLLRPNGERISQAAGSGPGRFESASLPPGLYVIIGRAEGDVFRKKVMIR